MILSGNEIVELVQRTKSSPLDLIPSIEIEPFDESLAGPNSYDVHLDRHLKVYALLQVANILDAEDRLDRAEMETHPYRAAVHAIRAEWKQRDRIYCGVDVRNPPPTVDIHISDEGLWLYPGILYLGATVERTYCKGLVPWLDGRSSVGRCGLSLHVTAGRGDDGWPGRWTLEITAVSHPVKVYPGLRCGQITFFKLFGTRKPYEGRYANQDGPTASRLHEETPRH